MISAIYRLVNVFGGTGRMIYIIRHGKTELNRLKVLQGRSNSPLNEEGIRQAERAAKMLQGIEFAHVFSSPLIRAVQTAEIVAPGKEITIDHRLIEMNYGPYEGTDRNHLPPEIITFFSDFVNNPAPDGMEPLESVVSRTDVFLEEIRNLEGNILVSTHAIAMKGILECLTPESHGAYWSKYIGNCSVYAAENADQTIGIPAEIVFPDP